MNKLSALKSEYRALVQQYPEADAQLKQLLEVLGDIEDMARHPSLCRGKCGMGWKTERSTAKVSKESHFLVPCTALIQ
jgi:hypothetical protein